VLIFLLHSGLDEGNGLLHSGLCPLHSGLQQGQDPPAKLAREVQAQCHRFPDSRASFLN
jgi:hypothetical protein